MVRYIPCLVFVILILSSRVSGQEGMNYQATMISNPAVTGSEGDGKVRLSYLNFYPGNNYNFHTVKLSYDSYFQSLHGGAGFYISDEYLGGTLNNLSGGFSYSYFLRATEKLYISAGLSASFYHRGYDFSGSILPDQLDPLLGIVLSSAETLTSRGRTVFDLGTGFMFITGRFFGGFSVSHLTEPDLSVSDYTESKLGRILLIHGAGNFLINRGRNINLVPLASVKSGNELLTAGAGASLESKYLAINAIFFAGNDKNIDLQAGFSINVGEFMMFYSYRINLVSGENLLPFSLLHHTGIALGLNNVDKRKIVKTINFPKL
jgi:type IX secretion system PorP/SprF family membrane protein